MIALLYTMSKQKVKRKNAPTIKQKRAIISKWATFDSMKSSPSNEVISSKQSHHNFPSILLPLFQMWCWSYIHNKNKNIFLLFFLSVSKMISKKLHSVLFINSIPEVRCTITKWPLTCRVHPDLKVGMSLYSTLSSSENPP